MSLFFNSRNIGEPFYLPRKANLTRRAKECQVYDLPWIALTANTLKGGQYTMLLLDPVAVIILESNWASCLTFVPGVGIATHSGKVSRKKSCSSFGFCPNYLPPLLPPIWTTCTIFSGVKIQDLKVSLGLKILYIIHYNILCIYNLKKETFPNTYPTSKLSSVLLSHYLSNSLSKYPSLPALLVRLESSLMIWPHLREERKGCNGTKTV